MKSDEYDRGWKEGFYMGKKFMSPNWFFAGMATMIILSILNQIANALHFNGVI